MSPLSQDEDLAIIAAQQYYIDYGPSQESVLERLQSLLPSYIPDSSLQGAKSLDYWMQGGLQCLQERLLCP